MRSIYARLPVSGHYLRRRVRLAGLGRRLAAFSILLMVVSVLFYRAGSIEAIALLWLLVLASGLAALGLVIACWGILRVWFQGFEGGGKVVSTLFLSLLALLPLGAAVYLAQTNPATNRAATQGFAPDEIASAITASEAGRATAPAVIADAPSVVAGRRYLVDSPRVYKAARDVLADLGWPIEHVALGDPNAPPDNRLGTNRLGTNRLGTTGAHGLPLPSSRAAAVAALKASQEEGALPESDFYDIAVRAHDRLFHFPAQATIRIVESNGETDVEMRSVSDLAPIDLGQNRRFITRFLSHLDDAMAGFQSVDPAS